MHHSVAAGSPDHRRHARLIAHKLAISFVALAAAPFFLAFRGAPAPNESLSFLIALVPMAAALLVARTGRIVAGHAVTVCGLVALAATGAMGAGVGLGAACAWLALAQWEAGLSGDRRLQLAAALLGMGTIAAAASLAPTVGVPSTGAVLGALAVAYAVTLGATSTAAQAPDAAAEPTSDLAARLSERLGDLVVAFDAGGSVEHVLGSSDRLLGHPAHELVGRGLLQLVQVADRPMFLTLLADAAASDAPRTAILRLCARDEGARATQRFLWVEIRAHGLAASAGTAPRVVAQLRDVTATHQSDVELAAARRAIEASARSKDEFLANMSHELRTPLNAIIGFSEMLASRTLRPAEADRQREYATIIHQSGQHLLSVVNSILDMSKIQSGTFAILPEPFGIAPLIDQCCDILRLKAQDGGVRLTRDCPEGLDEIVGDKRAYKQILLNLLSNAVKFTPADGEVSIAARPEGTALVVTIADTGIGIGAEDLARLGDPFFQARASHSRPFEGTGLGLSVVRGLLGLHGGTMSVESEPGRGTRVSVRLPLDCRVAGGGGTPATIERISRRSRTDTAYRRSDPRMIARA